MARFLFQTLIRTTKSPSSTFNSFQSLKLGIPQSNRFHSQSSKAELIEVDLESEGELEVLGLKKRELEDVIHSIIVSESTPDWLPFVPGSSYWVPPRLPESIAVWKVVPNPLNEDESMSVSSDRGWPSSDYFVEGTSEVHHVEEEVDQNQDAEG